MAVTVTEFLQNGVPFLAGLSGEQAHALAAASQQLSYSQGQTVLFQGTTVDGLYVVAAGKVGVWLKTDRTKPARLAAELGPGEVFGETSILEMTTAGATIKATADDTLLFLLPQEGFRSVLAQNDELRGRAQALITARKKKNSELVSSALVAA